MEVYLVRHGQTDGNVGKRHQHPSTKLNERGRAQAAAVAQVLTSFKPTCIITSTNLRAVETAEIIGLTNNLIPETHPAFEELHQPKSMVGERLTGTHALSYMVAWFFGIRAASMHDGESYDDFVKRLASARTYLESMQSDARVVIVSHSVFINFFIEHMKRPDRMGLTRAIIRFFNILLIKNTSLIELSYQKPDPQSRHKSWQVIRRR